MIFRYTIPGLIFHSILKIDMTNSILAATISKPDFTHFTRKLKINLLLFVEIFNLKYTVMNKKLLTCIFLIIANMASGSEIKTKTEKPVIQVVFLLDATGSMSGLIGVAKEKIWSIAGSLSQTDPAPDIEIGMIFYRDRGDDFITKHIPLGKDMDGLYEQLMLMQANGGGDLPESVNQAIYEGVTQIKWNTDPDTYRAIFLVGDCPPHMDYRNDVKYPESCSLANKKGIVINTILMGNNQEARKIWKEIADLTNGEFVQTDMKVNNIDVRTPFDDRINKLQFELDKTRVYYGSSKVKSEQKMIQSSIASSDAAVNARRAEFNMSGAGKASYYGTEELINDIINGKRLADVKVSQLPENMQKLTFEQLKNQVDSLIAKRKSLEIEIVNLSKQRQQHIENELKNMKAEEVESSFDNVIFRSVQKQAETKGIKIEGKAKR